MEASLLKFSVLVYHLNRITFLSLLLLFLTPYSFASPIEELSNELNTTRTDLIKLSLTDPLATDVPQEGVLLIQKLKNNLEALITAYLAQFTNEEDGRTIEKNLNALLKLEESTPSESEYGKTITISVKKSDSLLYFLSTFSIQCGTDSQLLIFQRKDRRWEKVLRWESEPYTSIDGALSTLQYTLTLDAFGGWYVLATTSAPWCSSTWSTLRYYILKPGENNVAFKKEYPIWLGNEDSVVLKASPRGFEVRFTSHSIDPDIHHRTYIHHYKIDRDTISRGYPVALTPRDFLDEWVSSPWVEASKWCKEKDCRSFQSIHELFQKLQTDSVLSFGNIKKRSPSLTEISLLHEQSSWHFTIEGKQNFKLLWVEN